MYTQKHTVTRTNTHICFHVQIHKQLLTKQQQNKHNSTNIYIIRQTNILTQTLIHTNKNAPTSTQKQTNMQKHMNRKLKHTRTKRQTHALMDTHILTHRARKTTTQIQ